MKYTKHMNLKKRKIHKIHVQQIQERYWLYLKRKPSYFEPFNISCTWGKVQTDVHLYTCTIYIPQPYNNFNYTVH